ncbi:hypothetical protein J2X20_002763 [Pelomonas saccharophila]|uniref:Uncharacterized protein n=1 Tax=Roseateles saccharophilus TaxID=304 RepID=A0ABU1YMN2_ROSSA|nr:hypothetical protein [Roseateles saccharophilus]MDR7270105.1 hypothetical protein [Roseateles saccharophilus]
MKLGDAALRQTHVERDFFEGVELKVMRENDAALWRWQALDDIDDLAQGLLPL